MNRSTAAALNTHKIWLRSREWDLIWITGSVVLVAFPILMYSFFKTDQARIIINLIVTVLVGGPHMYATATRTALEPHFVGRYKFLFFLGLLAIPAAVITLTLTSYTLLLTAFFIWASVHILHQASYIAGRYNDRSPVPMSRTSRLLDYAFIFSSLYPIGTYKLVEGTFQIGPTRLLFPPMLQTHLLTYLAFAFFIGCFILFTARTTREVRSKTANWPKIIFVYITAAAAFVVPAFNNLDTAFQGFNTWHSLQYLALTWHINQLRGQRGAIGSRFVKRMMEGESPNRFYGFNVLLTLIAGVFIYAVYWFSGFTIDQSYYTVVLSFLLLHYYFDHFLFFSKEDELKPVFSPAQA
ncbi:MAG TPA: hypothetical protein VI546_06095 [candidate division Zixibacteria bacterium]|nr:hypothetical protein [candidate division Zixibacteria bacterium]